MRKPLRTKKIRTPSWAWSNAKKVQTGKRSLGKFSDKTKWQIITIEIAIARQRLSDGIRPFFIRNDDWMVRFVRPEECNYVSQSKPLRTTTPRPCPSCSAFSMISSHDRPCFLSSDQNRGTSPTHIWDGLPNLVLKSGTMSWKAMTPCGLTKPR